VTFPSAQNVNNSFPSSKSTSSYPTNFSLLDMSNDPSHPISTASKAKKPKIFQICVRLLSGGSYNIMVNSDDKIIVIKEKLEELTGIPTNKQYLYGNKIKLNEEKTVSEEKIKSGNIIELLHNLHGGFH
jgi:hypothetical protein